MELIFLGTGTSQGVPCIGCGCDVCRSDDPHDIRTRPSAAVRLDDGRVILLDTTPELRIQSLAIGLERIDAVLYTHSHADHIMGMDDLRSFNQINERVIPCYADAATAKRLEGIFDYAVVPPGEDRRPHCPGVNMHAVEPGDTIDVIGQRVTAVPLIHNSRPILGWRIDTPSGKSVAYCTDQSEIPEASLKLLAGVDVLVLGALREKPHAAHMSLGQSLAAADRIAPSRTLFTHMNHDLPHAATNAKLPADKQLAHDGLVVEVA